MVKGRKAGEEGIRPTPIHTPNLACVDDGRSLLSGGIIIAIPILDAQSVVEVKGAHTAGRRSARLCGG